MTKLTPAAQLARMRRQVDKICPVCGAKFKAIKTAVCCGPTCKQRALRARKKQ